MQFRFSFKSLTICLALLSANPSLAEPFSFAFEMPSLNIFSLSGHRITLAITVDNGGDTVRGQSYSLADIQSIEVLESDLDGSLEFDLFTRRRDQGALDEAIIITTDATGEVEFSNVSETPAWVAFYHPQSDQHVQLATTEGSVYMGAHALAVRLGSDRHGSLVSQGEPTVISVKGQLLD